VAGILAKLEAAAGTAAEASEPAYLNRPISANTAAAAPTKNAQTAQRARHRSGRIAQICHKWGIGCVPIVAIPEHEAGHSNMQHRAEPAQIYRDLATRFRVLAVIESRPNRCRYLKRLAAQHEELAAGLEPRRVAGRSHSRLASAQTPPKLPSSRLKDR
jgi:hypothetical protein